MFRFIKRISSVIISLGILISCSNSRSWISYFNDRETDPFDRIFLQIIEDENQNLWAASYTGYIYFYDRDLNEWSVKLASEPIELGTVQTLALGTNGLIWIGTDSGVGCYQPNDEQWSACQIEDALTNKNIRTIFQDKTGVLWIGTTDSLITSKDNGSSWQIVKNNDKDFDDVVNQIYEDSHSTIWIAASGALYRYQPSIKEWTIYKDNAPSFDEANNSQSIFNEENVVLTSDTVWSIAEASNGTLWFGTMEGVNIYDPETNNWASFTMENGLIDNQVQSIMTDQQGAIWLGTAEGVTEYNPKTDEWVSFDDQNNFTDYTVTDILVDSEGILWFATFGDGIYQYNPNLK